ncbi:MAG: NAD-dependent epimerase/dehydratase family protein [Clostridia bacterium]
MDIMLVGGLSPMMKKLSLKLYKEGHKIYVLSGSRDPSKHYKHVFERYDFPYTADSLKEVFCSVNPDVTILLGAFDSNFYHKDSRKEAVEYSAGLQNILLSWAAMGKGRLIYLSSVEVYGNSYPVPVMEDVKPFPFGIRATTLLQAEESCRFYQERLEKDVIILRLDRLYDVPDDKNDALLGICEKKCLDAFRDGRVNYKKNYVYGLTYMGDAVESIYKVIVCKKHNYNLYNISSSKAYSEMEIVNAIEKCFDKEIEKFDDTLDDQRSVILLNKRFDEEFGFNVWFTPDEVIQKTLTFMRKHSERFLDSSHPGLSLWQRIYYSTVKFLGMWVPYIENLILFIPFFMMNNRATGSEYFSKIDLYLIYVLIFAVVHGQRQATLSAVLATAGYIFRQMYSNSGIAVMTDYNTYVWVAEIFIVGLVVGYMKDRINFLKEEKEQEHDFLSERVTDITDINDSNLRVKEGLITQVVNYNYSLGMVYDMIEKLGADDPTKILFRAVTLIKNVTECQDVSIYLFEESDYAQLFGYTSEKAASMGNRIYLPDKEPLYDAIERDIVFLNRDMDSAYPMIAYAVRENGKPNMMIMLWSIPFERMTIDESNRITVLGKLVRKAVRGAEEYYNVIYDERFSSDGKVLKYSAFSDLFNTHHRAKDSNMTNYVLLKVTSKDSENTRKIISETIYPFNHVGYGKDGGLYILLTGSGEEECEYLRAELSKKGIGTAISKETDI